MMIGIFKIRPMTLTLLFSSNGAILIPLLALIFNLNFLAKSLKMTHIEASILIKIGKGIPTILIYAFNNCDYFCCLDVKA